MLAAMDQYKSLWNKAIGGAPPILFNFFNNFYAMGGQTSGENFTFGAQYGYVVKNGKMGELVRDINISGNLYSTLKNIAAIANDLKLNQVGGCGKGQSNIRSCHGAPHTLVNDVVIGGA